MDGQPTPERPSPLGDQPDGGDVNKETMIHTVTREIEHRINLLQSPNTTTSSDSGNIDEAGKSAVCKIYMLIFSLVWRG